jgi:hypothetical protein
VSLKRRVELLEAAAADGVTGPVSVFWDVLCGADPDNLDPADREALERFAGEMFADAGAKLRAEAERLAGTEPDPAERERLGRLFDELIAAAGEGGDPPDLIEAYIRDLEARALPVPDD